MRTRSYILLRRDSIVCILRASNILEIFCISRKLEIGATAENIISFGTSESGKSFLGVLMYTKVDFPYEEIELFNRCLLLKSRCLKQYSKAEL